MVTKYDVEISNDMLEHNIRRIISQVFALLPMREEGKDWVKPLETLINETLGLSTLFPQEPNILTVSSKLQGLLDQEQDGSFAFYRRTIFECCNLLSKMFKEEERVTSV